MKVTLFLRNYPIHTQSVFRSVDNKQIRIKKYRRIQIHPSKIRKPIKFQIRSVIYFGSVIYNSLKLPLSTCYSLFSKLLSNWLIRDRNRTEITTFALIPRFNSIAKFRTCDGRNADVGLENDEVKSRTFNAKPPLTATGPAGNRGTK